MLDPKAFIITRKRKKYKFALFHNSPLCFEVSEWQKDQPIDMLEMGAGTGLFSVALADSLPSKSIVAVDVKADRLQKGARLAQEEGLCNVRFLRAHADQLVEIISPHTLDAVWVTFPDPFPKDRAAKHRLTHPRFLEYYQHWLSDSGKLYFKTDAVAPFEWSLEQLNEQGWNLHELTFDLHGSHLNDLYKTPTTYEARFTAEGKRIGFVIASPPKLQ
jgi:tRNA (guanine-N7-)-methyltransferase